jgi:hypothetical protein
MKAIGKYWAILYLLLSSQIGFSFCGLELAFWDSQLLSSNGKVLRAAAYRGDNHYYESPFIYNPKFRVIRSQFWLGARLLEEKTGIVLRLEGSKLIAEFQQGSSTLKDSFDIPFSYHALLEDRPFPSFLPWPGKSYEALTQLMEEKIIPRLLSAPEKKLKQEFLNLVGAPHSHFKGMALFPRYTYRVPGQEPVTDELNGIHFEGRVNTKRREGQYALIQALIRKGQLQIWWIDTNKVVKYQKYPLTWVFDAKGNVRKDLLTDIYDQALSLGNEQTLGFDYFPREVEPKVTVSNASLSRNLGWEITEEGLPSISVWGLPRSYDYFH